MKSIYLSLLPVLVSSTVCARSGLSLPATFDIDSPLSWSAGVDYLWDSNTNPGGNTDGDESYSLNPFISAVYNNVSGQTSVSFQAKLGAAYYLEELEASGSEDIYNQSNLSFSLDHNISERLRYRTYNDVALQLEPDYNYGIVSARQSGESLYYSTDHALGFRWSSLFGTYTGVKYYGSEFIDVDNTERTTYEFYNQFRYQFDPITTLTADYRYAITDPNYFDGDILNNYFLLGLERKINANSLLVTSAGLQMSEYDNAQSNDYSSPYVEFALRSAINTRFRINSYLRYGLEYTDNTVQLPVPAVYEEKSSLRLGVNTSFAISQRLSFFNGFELVSASFMDGRALNGTSTPIKTGDELLWNANLGFSVKLSEIFYGRISYNYTDSDSDLDSRSYDRNRLSIGVNAQF